MPDKAKNPEEERAFAILDEIEAEEAVFLETDYDPEPAHDGD